MEAPAFRTTHPCATKTMAAVVDATDAVVGAADALGAAAAEHARNHHEGRAIRMLDALPCAAICSRTTICPETVWPGHEGWRDVARRIGHSLVAAAPSRVAARDRPSAPLRAVQALRLAARRAEEIARRHVRVVYDEARAKLGDDDLTTLACKHELALVLWRCTRQLDDEEGYSLLQVVEQLLGETVVARAERVGRRDDTQYWLEDDYGRCAREVRTGRVHRTHHWPDSGRELARGRTRPPSPSSS